MPIEPNNKRRFFRLTYPSAARPRFVIRDKTWSVIDLSEGGAKIAAKKSWNPEVSSTVKGTIVFTDGERQDVAGAVLRKSDLEWVIQFASGVPFSRMMNEQRRLFGREENVRGPRNGRR